MALSVQNMVTYMPVAVATYASMPISTRIGQKIFPGPIPQRADAIEPKNDIRTKTSKFFGVASRSPGTKLYPQSTFCLYSFLTTIIPTMVIITQTTYKMANKLKSVLSQRLVPIRDSSGSPLPLSKLITVRKIIMPQLRPNFFHWRLVDSALMSSSSLSFFYRDYSSFAEFSLSSKPPMDSEISRMFSSAGL